MFKLGAVLFRGNIDTIRGGNVAGEVVIVLVLGSEIGGGTGEIPRTLVEEFDKSKDSWSGGG